MIYIQSSLLLITFFLLSWPFKVNGVSSQILALLFFLTSVIINKKIYKPRITSKISLLLFSSIILLAFISLFFGHGGYVFVLYLIKIPVIIYIVNHFVTLMTERGMSITFTISLIATSSLIHSLIILLQLLFPEFQKIAIYNNSEAIKEFFITESGGHFLRYYGVNGFLFASDGISFALFGILLKIIRINKIKTNFFFIAAEYSCIIISTIAARSSIPLILLYATLGPIYQGSLKKHLTTFITSLFIVSIFSWIALNNLDNSFFFWITEPFLSSFRAGTLDSNSLNETISSYDIKLNILEFLFGIGYYSPSNNDYLNYFLQPSDSGYIRSIYVYGLLGLSLFIFYSINIHLSNSSNKKHLLVKTLIFLYMLIFFFKSEILYQNSFLICMTLLNKLYEKSKS